MNIENTWQQGSGSDDALNKMLQSNDFSNLSSKLPLRKLKKNLLMGLIWAALITVGYIVLLFIVNIWQVNVVLAILIFFNSWISIGSFKLYKKINVNISTANSLKEELQKNYNGFKKWWHIQEQFGLFVYPIAAAGGFILGGAIGSGKSVEEFLYNPRMLLILAVTLMILAPICYYGARWMFNYAYGKHLKKLKELIDELSNLE